MNNHNIERSNHVVLLKRLTSEKAYVKHINGIEQLALKSLITLPVVFHIVHNIGVENIFNIQIINALD